jgi:hypothetical protein
LYKSEKQLKMARQEVLMKEDEIKRMVVEATEEKLRYSKLLGSKN